MTEDFLGDGDHRNLFLQTIDCGHVLVVAAVPFTYIMSIALLKCSTAFSNACEEFLRYPVK